MVSWMARCLGPDDVSPPLVGQAEVSQVSGGGVISVERQPVEECFPVCPESEGLDHVSM